MRPEDKELFRRLKKALKKRNKSLSEWIREEAEDWLRRHEFENPKSHLEYYLDGPQPLTPEQRFRSCKWRGFYMHPNWPYAVAICRDGRPRPVGQNYEKCAKCDKWAHKSEVKK